MGEAGNRKKGRGYHARRIWHGPDETCSRVEGVFRCNDQQPIRFALCPSGLVHGKQRSGFPGPWYRIVGPVANPKQPSKVSDLGFS